MRAVLPKTKTTPSKAPPVETPLPEIDDLLWSQIVEPQVAPAAVACVGIAQAGLFWFFEGAAGQRSALRPERVTPGMVFDLASLTKPCFAVVLARLAEQGHCNLGEPLRALLPELADTAAGNVSLELHLAHRAGLEAHLELFRARFTPAGWSSSAALLAAASAHRPDCRGQVPEQGFAPMYSDLGYLLLGAGIARRLGEPLDVIVERELAGLGLNELRSVRGWLHGDSDFSVRVVPTETVEYRGGEVCGAVHDDNAWALAELGLCGHAGLFGTARSVTHFGKLLLDLYTGRSNALSPGSLHTLLKPRPGAALRAGFDGKSPLGSTAGNRLGANSFGHLGFTGTSFWCAPEQGLVVTLLCNRVCPSRENNRLKDKRAALNDALIEIAQHAVRRARSD